jgi:hypothetical protein
MTVKKIIRHIQGMQLHKIGFPIILSRADRAGTISYRNVKDILDLNKAMDSN